MKRGARIETIRSLDDLSEKGSDKIAVRVHPPERRRRAPAVAASCCCTCSCCCFHAIGGLIGAACAGVPRTPTERWTVAAYWCCLTALFGISYMVLSPSSDDPRSVLFNLFWFLPGLQIAASVVAAVIAWIAAGPKALRRIWRITWRGVLGTVIGLLLMLVFYKGFLW